MGTDEQSLKESLVGLDSDERVKHPARNGANVGYGLLHWGLFWHLKLKPNAAALLVLIVSLSKKTGFCYASRATLAKMLNLSPPTVIRYIKKLEAKGLVKRSITRKEHGTIHVKPWEEWIKFIEKMDDARMKRGSWKYYEGD